MGFPPSIPPRRLGIQLDGRFVPPAKVAKGEGLALALAVAGRVAGGVRRALDGTQGRAVPALRHAAAERLAVAGLGGRLVGYPGASWQLGQALARREIAHRGRGGGLVVGGVLALAAPPGEGERCEDEEQASDARADADAGLAACRETGGSDLGGVGCGCGCGGGCRGEVGVLPADGHGAAIVEDVPGGLLSAGLGDGLGNEGRAGLGLGPGKGLPAAVDAEATIAGFV